MAYEQWWGISTASQMQTLVWKDDAFFPLDDIDESNL